MLILVQLDIGSDQRQTYKRKEASTGSLFWFGLWSFGIEGFTCCQVNFLHQGCFLHATSAPVRGLWASRGLVHASWSHRIGSGLAVHWWETMAVYILSVLFVSFFELTDGDTLTSKSSIFHIFQSFPFFLCVAPRSSPSPTSWRTGLSSPSSYLSLLEATWATSNIDG